MTKILIRGPLLTQSGYGVHARQIFRWAQSRGYDISVNLTPWGITPWYVNPKECNGLIEDIMKATNPPTYVPDISFQVQLPNEWDPNLCKKNIGVTAGVETNICNPQWVSHCKQMDKVVVPTTFTANTFSVSGFKDCIVIPETYHDTCGESEVIELKKITKLPTKKNFLLFGQITGENSELDRKNTWDAVECFLNTFKKHSDVGLIIKTNSGTNCKMDLRVTERKLKNFLSNIRSKNCKARVYLLHGYLNEKEIAGLYRSKKIMGLISATRGEGFGLPLLEASVSGLPVIATDWSGHKDFLDKGEWLAVENNLKPVHPAKIDGNIFVPGAQWAQIDKSDFTKKLLTLYKNPGFYKNKAKLLSKKIKSEFSFDAIALKYDDLMSNL